jgi:hypothetical protein
MKELHELMALQGEFRVNFIRLGVDHRLALELACEALTLLVESPVATEAHRRAYAGTGTPDLHP